MDTAALMEKSERQTVKPQDEISDEEDSFPDEVIEEGLSELLASLSDDEMLTLLTDFGLTEEGVADG